MAENKMKEVAKMLGVEMGVPFNVKGVKDNPYTLTKDGLYDKNDDRDEVLLNFLLTGTYEIVPQILTQKEKAYLEGVLRPFKDRVVDVCKVYSEYLINDNVHIQICLHCEDIKPEELIRLPHFRRHKMYKKMKMDKAYTLEELGLFVD